MKQIIFAIKTILIISLINNKLNSVETANILVWFPLPSVSHQVFAYPLVRELAQRGHDVTFITTNPLKDPKLTNVIEIDISYSYDFMSKFVYEAVTKFDDNAADFGHSQKQRQFNKLFQLLLEKQLNDPNIENVLSQKFDVFLGEQHMFLGQVYLKHILKCPSILVSTLSPGQEGYAQVGDLINPSYESSYMVHFKRPRNFFEKVCNVLHRVYESSMFKYNFRIGHQNIFRKKYNFTDEHFEDYSVDLIIANVHPVMTGVRAEYPNVIGVGGMLKKTPKPLPKDLQDYLDKGTEGVVYFSLGSNVKSNLLPAEKREIFIKAFEKLPYRVLWKFESDTLENKPRNVRISKWLPQMDVLSHPNVKLFITQGGIQSFEETVYARVPVIGIPFFADQEWNTDHMSNMGMGVKLDANSLTVDKLIDAVKTVISEQRFQDKMNEMGDLLEDSPIKPLDKAIYWIEYVIRHKGAKILENPALNMSLFEFLCLDVVLFLVGLIAIVVGVIAFFVRGTVRFIKRRILCREKIKKN